MRAILVNTLGIREKYIDLKRDLISVNAQTNSKMFKKKKRVLEM